MKPNSRMVIAGLREAGAVCPECQGEIHAGDQTTLCPRCGNVHHWMCWSEADGCASYECAPDNRSVEADDAPVVRISADDLARATPLPPARPAFNGWTSAPPLSLSDHPLTGPKRWNRLAIAALVVAILGIPLFGLVTGLVAIVLGCIALAGHSRRSKGALVAVFGILLGVVDMAGWAIGLALVFEGGVTRGISLDEFVPDPAALEQLPAPVSRAMKSNVLIQTPGDLMHLRGAGIGSGVIVRIKEGIAWIVTNRHVVDDAFAEDRASDGEPKIPAVRLTVKAIGQPSTPAEVVWIAPNGIDLALITMPVTSTEIMAAVWDAQPKLVVGESVFAVGNPHGLGWTHTQGGLSQLRLQSKGPREIRILQTSAAINPGNSGGGLYDSQGHLLGINTWTKDKRMAEGLSFSIAFHTLLPLLPANYKLPASQLETDVP